MDPSIAVYQTTHRSVSIDSETAATHILTSKISFGVQSPKARGEAV